MSLWRKKGVWRWQQRNWFHFPELLWYHWMNRQEYLFSPITNFHCFMCLVWSCPPPESEIYWSWTMRTSSIKNNSKQILVLPRKPPGTFMYFDNGQTYGLKIRVNIWTRIDMVPVEYWIFSRNLHLVMWLFQFINVVTFRWDYVMWMIVSLLVWNEIWTKLRIYRVPPDPVKWNCQVFGLLW